MTARSRRLPDPVGLKEWRSEQRGFPGGPFDFLAGRSGTSASSMPVARNSPTWAPRWVSPSGRNSRSTRDDGPGTGHRTPRASPVRGTASRARPPRTRCRAACTRNTRCGPGCSACGHHNLARRPERRILTRVHHGLPVLPAAPLTARFSLTFPRGGTTSCQPFMRTVSPFSPSKIRLWSGSRSCGRRRAPR